MTRSREEEIAILTKLKKQGVKSIDIGLMKPLSTHKNDNFTIIAMGSGNSKMELYGLPLVEINKARALKLKKENGLEAQRSIVGTHGYAGKIPIEEFEELLDSPENTEHRDNRLKIESEKETEFHNEGIKEIHGDMKKEKEEEDPHVIPQTILDQLQASKINGFPFFAYTGIKGFVMLGNDQLMLKDIPRNPNHISSVTITYDVGRDMYNMMFQKGKFPKNVPVKEIDGVFFDQLSDIIVDTMGVR